MQALRLVDVQKSYGAVNAVRGVHAGFDAGEIHAVVGENGAGKSTLLKIAAGIVVPDAGTVYVAEAQLRPHTAAEAIRRGVGMVQQHFALVPVFTVLENIVLGAEPTGLFGQIDYRKAHRRARAVLEELGADLPLATRVADLNVGERQRLEIARVLFRDAKTLILDEPTAVLTPAEADALYATLRRLASGGRAVVVVTHKLDEVVRHADAVTVLRRGELVETRRLPKVEERAGEAARLSAAMMGGAVPHEPARPQGAIGGPALVFKEVTLAPSLDRVSFEVRSGEVVGIAGIEGNGQTELVRAIAGQLHAERGVVWPKPDGVSRRKTPAVAIVFEDRHTDGLVLDASLRDNLVLGELGSFTEFGVLRAGDVDEEARVRCDRGGVQPHDLDLEVRALSGGNQQKVVVARALARVEAGAQALVLAHPTRGVDLGAARAIHAQILDVVARYRIGVLVVSSDLAELRVLCHRILVMAGGRIVKELPPTATDAEIGEHMLGVTADGAPAPPLPGRPSTSSSRVAQAGGGTP